MYHIDPGIILRIKGPFHLDVAADFHNLGLEADGFVIGLARIDLVPPRGVTIHVPVNGDGSRRFAGHDGGNVVGNLKGILVRSLPDTGLEGSHRGFGQ